MENPNSPATSRQLFALYCITKKDYRNEGLTKEQAANLISELGSKDYVKKTKRVKKTLSEELLEYLTEHFDEMFGGAVKSLAYKSVVETDPDYTAPENMKQYAFVGVGCGITFPVYRKNNKKLKEIDEAARKYRWNEIEKMFMDKFSKTEIEHYKSIGCPLGAIWSQDQGMQMSYWHTVQAFAESKGLEMSIRSMLD